MKKIMALIAAVFIFSQSLSVALAENGSLSAFTKVRTYYDELFTDNVSWGRDYLIQAYEYGIISGNGHRLISPNGALTRAEAFTIAAKIHASYKYGADADAVLAEYTNSSEWYSPFVDYCVAEKLIDSELNGLYNQPITRAQMLRTWSLLLEPEDMAAQNTVYNLPDVDSSTKYYSEISNFYRAGIVVGTDANGTFLPNNNITRQECAVIFMRLILPQTRESGRVFFYQSKPFVSLFGAPLDASVDEVNSVLGTPSETIQISSGIEWKLYHNASYSEFCMARFKNGISDAIYSTTKGWRDNIFKNDAAMIDDIGSAYSVTKTFSDSNDGNRAYAGLVMLKDAYSASDYTDERAAEQLVFELTNAFRGIHGLKPFKWNDTLSKAALAHAKDMADKGYFGHNNLEGLSVGDRLTNAGYKWHECSENIEAGHGRDPSAIVDAWVNSSGHRINMLGGCSELGVGFVYEPGTVYTTYSAQNFGTPR